MRIGRRRRREIVGDVDEIFIVGDLERLGRGIGSGRVRVHGIAQRVWEDWWWLGLRLLM